MIKAVFFDIDGTLLSFKTHTIPKSAVDAIIKLKENGIKVFIASGRSLAQLPKFEVEFDGYITLNGAYCIDKKGVVIVDKPFPKDTLMKLVRFQQEKYPFACSLMTNSGTFVNFIDEKVEALAKLVNLPVPKVKNIDETVKINVYQLNVYVEDFFELELMKNIFTNCEASRWNPIFFDVNPSGVNKQTSIDAVINHYGINISETMAFGDGGNDISMLKHVAIGIAMENAVEEVKLIANYITDSVDNDGIWKALEKYKLI